MGMRGVWMEVGRRRTKINNVGSTSFRGRISQSGTRRSPVNLQLSLGGASVPRYCLGDRPAHCTGVAGIITEELAPASSS